MVNATACHAVDWEFDPPPSRHFVNIEMIVIRRMVDKHKSYTAIFLPGSEPKIFPTTDYEHNRILQIFKQDKFYKDIINDFNNGHVA